MKKSIFVFALATLFCATTWAKVRTVSQDAATPAQYTTIAAAMTASAAGDTIYINGSAAQYPNFTVTKINLTFIGAGYSPVSKDNPLATNVNYIYLDTAGNNQTGRGTKLYGLNIQGGISVGPSWGGAQPAKNQNVVISRCYINSLDVCGDNWLITNNVINYWLNIEYHGSILISNNIFNSGGYMQYSSQNNVIITNNLFWRYNGNVMNYNMTFATFTNNILVGTNTTAVASNNSNNFTYNLTFAIFGSNGGENLNMPGGVIGSNTGTNNVTNNDPLFNFEVATPIVNATTFSLAYDFTLQSGSPALTASASGSQIGIYGGSYPWMDNTGMTALPYVKHMTISSVVPAGGTIDVNVTGKRHN